MCTVSIESTLVLFPLIQNFLDSAERIRLILVYQTTLFESFAFYLYEKDHLVIFLLIKITPKVEFDCFHDLNFRIIQSFGTKPILTNFYLLLPEHNKARLFTTVMI